MGTENDQTNKDEGDELQSEMKIAEETPYIYEYDSSNSDLSESANADLNMSSLAINYFGYLTMVCTYQLVANFVNVDIGR
jgi:hypothetical protein